MQSCNSKNSTAEPLSLADRIERIERALTAKELAEILAVSRITIFKQAKAGRIPSFRIGTCVRFDPRSVAQWLRRDLRPADGQYSTSRSL
jgi:excisionase family DNA binding protein